MLLSMWQRDLVEVAIFVTLALRCTSLRQTRFSGSVSYLAYGSRRVSPPSAFGAGIGCNIFFLPSSPGESLGSELYSMLSLPLH